MSFKALAWASEQKVGGSTEKLVLMCLANYANDNDECYPSHKTICNFVEVQVPTVIRALHQLRLKNFISVKPQYQKTQSGKNRQTSNLYVLNIPPSENITGYGLNRDTPPPHENVRQTNNKYTNINDYSEDFNQWWDLYPRNDGSKRKAFELWKRITDKEITINELYTCTIKFKKSTNGKDQKFIPHATTWLNQRRFETVETNVKTSSKNQLVG